MIVSVCIMPLTRSSRANVKYMCFVIADVLLTAPNDRMKEVLRKTISEAKSAVSKVSVH